jgi:hypothetical protein
MMQSADPRHRHNSGPGRVASFDGSCDWRVFVQRIVDAVLMIVAEVLTNEPSRVGFIEDDHVIQQFPPTTAYSSFRNPILSGTLTGCPDQVAT